MLGLYLLACQIKEVTILTEFVALLILSGCELIHGFADWAFD